MSAQEARGDDYYADRNMPVVYQTRVTACIEGSVNSFANGASLTEVNLGNLKTMMFDKFTKNPSPNMRPTDSEYPPRDLEAFQIIVLGWKVLDHDNNLPGQPAIGITLPNSANIPTDMHAFITPSGHEAALHIIDGSRLLNERQVYRRSLPSGISDLEAIKNDIHGADKHKIDLAAEHVHLMESHPIVRACKAMPSMFTRLGLSMAINTYESTRLADSINDLAVPVPPNGVHYLLEREIFDKAVKILKEIPAEVPIENTQTDLIVKFSPVQCKNWAGLPSLQIYAGNKSANIQPKYSKERLDEASQVKAVLEIDFMIPQAAK